MQRDWWRDDIFNDAKNDFLHRDLAKMPPRDIAAIITLADRADDRELLTYAGKMMVQRAPEFTTAADGIEFYKLGIFTIRRQVFFSIGMVRRVRDCSVVYIACWEDL